MTILEAMSAGVAVVASRVGAAEDVIEDGRTGLLYEPGDVPALVDAVKSLIDDDHRRKDIGNAAQAAVRAEFTVDEMARRYAEQYRKVLGRTQQ